MLHPKEKEMRKLLQFLSEHNQYFKRIFEKQKINLNEPIEIIFKQLPIMTKQDIRENYNHYLSDIDMEKFSEYTSGSTGTPVNCVKTRAERTTASLNIWQQRRKWDQQIDLNKYIYLYDHSTYKKVGNLLNFEKNNMIRCFNRLIELHPRWLSGPISSFERYARLIENKDINYQSGSIKFIELAGEYASRDQRDYVEKIFGCRTINHYGTIESWCIAYECPLGNLHVQNKLIYAEVTPTKKQIDDKNVGEITITSLYNKLMPLVRYNIQDLGTVKEVDCECGQRSQVIHLLGGRTGDIIAGTDDILGELFFKRGVYKVINTLGDCINGFRIEQTELKKFIVFIERGEGYIEEAELIMRKHILRGLGQDTTIQFKYVESIPPLASGKVKIFYSHL